MYGYPITIDLTKQVGYQFSIPSDGHQGDIPYL